MTLDLVFRNCDEEDLGFIFKSWLVNFRASNHLEQFISHTIYFANQTALIKKILEKSNCILATSPEDQRQIFGFIVYERIKDIRMIHYVYVKSPFRRFGIATQLKDFVFMDDDKDSIMPIFTTHHTRMAHLLSTKWNLIFNPYLLLDFYGEKF